MATTPPGWYADPEDELQARYWDGERWTDHRRDLVVLHDAESTGPDDPAPGDPVPRRRRLPSWSTHPLAIAGAVLVVVAVVAGILVATSSPTEATEVTLEDVASAGEDPFMDSIATDASDPAGAPGGEVEAVDAGASDAVGSVSGSAPELYGVTGEQEACDAAALVGFLEANPAEAEAWAEVQGLEVDAIGGFVESLVPVVLREDTRVTNHGFSDGEATAFQSVLQAGTAVLVDERGTPRVRCACGNPLVEPEGSTTDLELQGEPWEGFDRDRLVAVDPSSATLEALTVVDLATGEPEDVPTGAAAVDQGDTGGIVLRNDGLGIVDFGAPGEEAIAAVTEVLGEPDLRAVLDTPGGEANGEGCLGQTAGNTAERVVWGRFSITVSPDAGGFYVWRFQAEPSDPAFEDVFPDSDLQTPEGIGQGSTADEFRAAYPDTTAESTTVIIGSSEGDVSDEPGEDLDSGTGYLALAHGGDLLELEAWSVDPTTICVGFDGFVA